MSDTSRTDVTLPDIIPDIPPPVLVRRPSEGRIQDHLVFWSVSDPRGPDNLLADAVEISRRYLTSDVRTVCLCISQSGMAETKRGVKISKTCHLNAFNIWVNQRGPHVTYVAPRSLLWDYDEVNDRSVMVCKHSGRPIIIAWPPSRRMMVYRAHLRVLLNNRVSGRMFRIIQDMASAAFIRYPRDRYMREPPILVRGTIEDYVRDLNSAIIDPSEEDLGTSVEKCALQITGA